MKRFVCWILVFVSVLSITTISLAEISIFETNEKFSIRNGITFGMNSDEIDEIETANGNVKLVGEDGDWSFFYPGYDSVYEIMLGGGESNILYYMDSEDKLSGFKYVVAEKPYSSIVQTLTNKYGKPASFDDKLSLETQALNVSSEVNRAFKPTLTQYDCWLVQYLDCYVFIEATIMKTTDYYISTNYRVDYTFFSHEEISSLFLIKDLWEQNAEQSLEEGL